MPALLIFSFLAGCAPHPQELLQRRTGLVVLPAGNLLLHHELVVPAGARDLEIRGDPAGTTLQAAPDFDGRAVIVSEDAASLRLSGFRIEGNRPSRDDRIGLPTGDLPFARFYRNNGILISRAAGLSIRNVACTQIVNYPLLINSSSGVRIEDIRIADSGSFDAKGHNNASGGILLEEGTRDFEVRHCTLQRVRGNGIWTHSYGRSPRNESGFIRDNLVEDVARDAIQVGHATRITVDSNTGRRIGYPLEAVDMAGWAVPAALDTAGNVDRSSYTRNRFEEVNGKCMDLDGFHDGEIRNNACISRRPAADYPFSQFAIVFNNANPDMQSRNVAVTDNLIDGAGYGALFLLGSNHVIAHNRFLRLNLNHCTEDRTRPHCDYSAGDPLLLRTGIYLVSGAARPAGTAGNQVTDNEVSGFGMSRHCVAAAPGVRLSANRVAGNRCLDE